MGVASDIVNNKKKKKHDSFIATSIKLSISLDTFGERGIELNGDIYIKNSCEIYIKSIKKP